MSHDPTEARLSRLRDATSAVRPRADFVGRVVARLAPLPARGWLDELFVVAKNPLRFAALLAAVLFLLAIRVDQATNLEIALDEAYEEEW